MIYYFKNDAESIINIRDNLTEEEKLKLEKLSLISELDLLQELNIEDFNYFIFEEDIEKLTETEFEYIFSTFFDEFLQDIEDKYLNLDYHDNYINFESQIDKKVYLKKIIFFITYIFPYEIFKNILKSDSLQNIVPESVDISELNRVDFERIFDIDYNENLRNLKSLIIKDINNKNIKLDNWYKKLDELSTLSKKDTLEESIDILDTHIQKQKLINDIYIKIIDNTDTEKLVNLLNTYIKQDFYNLVY